MQAIGISEKLQTTILLTEFEDIRYTRTCKFWLLDTMTNVYLTLGKLDKHLQANADLIRRSQDEPSQPDAMIPCIPSAINLHTMIWRAGPKFKAEAFYNQSTGIIDLGALNTFPGDFNGERSVAYWTPQKETADRYAQFVKAINRIVDIAIIQVAVPEQLIRNLSVEYLWYSEVWKKVIWHGRNAKELPEELRYINDKDLLIGHIASGRHVNYVRLKDYNHIKEQDILNIDVSGEQKKAVQWGFQTRKARREFEQASRGRVWIHDFGTYLTPPKEST